MTIEERHDCELCYVRVRLCRMGREKAQQRGTVAVLGRGERERERWLCHFVFTSLSLPRMHNNQNKLLPN